MSTNATSTTSAGAAERNHRLGRIADHIAAAVAADSSAAVVSFAATGGPQGPVGSKIRIGRHTVGQDEPAAFGGTDAAPNPLEYALAALVSCQLVTYRFWAAKLDIPVEDIQAAIDGDLDLRGFLGLDNEVRPGFRQIRVTVTVRGPAPAERYHHLAAAADAHCPTLDLFSHTTPIHTELVVR